MKIGGDARLLFVVVGSEATTGVPGIVQVAAVPVTRLRQHGFQIEYASEAGVASAGSVVNGARRKDRARAIGLHV